MADFEIKITTPAELSGARAAEKSLETQIAKAKALGQDYSVLEARLAGVRKGIADFETGDGAGFFGKLGGQLREVASQIPGLERLGGIIGGLSSGPLGVVAAGFAAIAGALKVAASGIREFAGAQDSVAGLDAALARTGQLTDENREKTQALAGAMQEATGIADDQWIDVQRRLIQLTSRVGEGLERDVEAVKNLAGLMDGDLKAASEAVGQALGGNFEAFKRFGIELEANASRTEKLNQLYTELAQRGGGQLEARAKTLSGQWDALKNNTSDLLEAVGRFISRTGVLQKSMELLSNAAEQLAKWLGGLVPPLESLQNAQKKTTEALDNGAAAAGRQAAKIAAIKSAADEASSAVDRLVSQLKRQNSEEDQLAAAKKEAELAKLDEIAARDPNISQQALAEARAQIEIRYAREREQREIATNERIAAAAKKAVDLRNADMQSAEKALAAERLKEQQQRARATEEARLAKAQEVVTLREAEYKNAVGSVDNFLGGEQMLEKQKDVERTRGLLEDALKTAAAQRRRLEQAPNVTSSNVPGALADYTAAKDAFQSEYSKREPEIEAAESAINQTKRLGAISRETQASRRNASNIKASREDEANLGKQASEVGRVGDEIVGGIGQLGEKTVASFNLIQAELSRQRQRLEAVEKQARDNLNR